jgi:predicted molibdopterin-dependent oxidoreductase YjgC
MWLPNLSLVIYHRFQPSPLDERAHVILPGHAFTEKDGTVTNMEGRVQRINAGIDAARVRDDWRVLRDIANRMGAGWGYESVAEITADLPFPTRAVSASNGDTLILHASSATVLDLMAGSLGG